MEKTLLRKSLLSQFRTTEFLTRMMLRVPSYQPPNDEATTYRELIRTKNDVVSPFLPSSNVSSSGGDHYKTRSLILDINNAQREMIEIAKQFKQNKETMFLEHPQVLLPLASLSAVQEFPLLTPDNYASELRKLLHAIFRHWFPGATFRSRKDSIVLYFNGSTTIRSHAFASFMKGDNYWNNFLTQRVPTIALAIKSFEDAHKALFHDHFEHNLHIRTYHVEHNPNEHVSRVTITLPDKHKLMKRELLMPDGTMHEYLKNAELSFLEDLICRLSTYAQRSLVLSTAYPVLKNMAAKQHAITQKKELAMNTIARHDFYKQLEKRVINVTPDELESLSEPVKQFILSSMNQDEGKVFLPFTKRGFNYYGAHHIYVRKSIANTHLHWTPLPPMGKGHKLSLNIGEIHYSYQGISTQTAYVTDSPRSSHGESPHVFQNLLYTALHVEEYNALMVEHLNEYRIDDSLKSLITDAHLAMQYTDEQFMNELDQFVISRLFTTEPAPPEDHLVEEEHQEETPPAATEQPSIPPDESNHMFSLWTPDNQLAHVTNSVYIRVNNMAITDLEDRYNFIVYLTIGNVAGYRLSYTTPKQLSARETTLDYIEKLQTLIDAYSSSSNLYEKIIQYLQTRSILHVTRPNGDSISNFNL